MKFLTKACFGMLLAASALSTPAFAQEEASGPFSLSGGISVTSDYRFRGVSLSNEKVAVQPTLTLSHESGFYVGVWGSSLPDSPPFGKCELDVYGGYRGKFSDAVSYDVGAAYYWYPGDFPSGFNSADTLEVYAGITVVASDKVSLGAKYSHATTDLFGYVDSDGSGYLDFSANFSVGAGVTINAHAGKQWIEGNAAFEYTDWKLGATKAFDNGFSVALAYTGTDADDALYTNPFGNKVADDTVALTITKAF